MASPSPPMALQTPGRIRLDQLPEELLLHVLRYFDVPAPSADSASRTPLALDVILNRRVPLKHLRESSKQLCRLATPILFRHVRLTVEELTTLFDKFEKEISQLNCCPHPTLDISQYPEWLQCILACSPSDGLDSLVLYTWRTRELDELLFAKPRLHGSLHLLLKIVRMRRLILLCPPHTLADLVDCTPYFGDYSSFVIPFQRLELRVKDSNKLLLGTSNPLSYLDGPFTGRALNNFQWDEVEYNAGSSLNAYGTYHYFEKTPPCIFFPRDILPFTGLLQNLTSFSYICVFPHNHHFNMSILGLLRSMRKLAHLEVRMAPDPADSLLSDTETIGRGNLNLRDCWNEIERSYLQIIMELLPDHHTLETFISHDCRIPAFASTFDELWRMGYADRLREWRPFAPGVYKAPLMAPSDQDAHANFESH